MQSNSLNPSQTRFCKTKASAIRLLAPAGCGKTQSLLWRCRSIQERNPEESNKFIIVTFTRAAQAELVDRLRVDPAFKAISPSVTVTTLNAWGYRRLRSSTQSLKLLSNKRDRYFCLENVLKTIWTKYPRINSVLADSRRRNRGTELIMDASDNLKALGFRHDRIRSEEDFSAALKAVGELGLQPRLETGLFDPLKSMEVIGRGEDQTSACYQHFVRFWIEATEHLRQSAIITLEDQKYLALLDLSAQIDLRRTWSGAARYRHVLVDEFQDINPLDLALIQALRQINKADLTLVGDDDQSIYEWRGASPSYILDPAAHFGTPFETHLLDTNYRSARNILTYSQKLISRNLRRVDKRVSAASKQDAEIRVIDLATFQETLDFVLALVEAHTENPDAGKIALVSRKRAQLVPYQILFASRGVAFYAAEDLQVMLGEAYKALKSTLAIRTRARTNSYLDSDPVSDVVTLCDRMMRFPLSKANRGALAKALQRGNPRTFAAVLSTLHGLLEVIPKNEDGKLTTQWAENLSRLVATEAVAEAVSLIGEKFTGLQKDYGKAAEDIFYADPPFLYLADFASRYGSDFGSFLTDLGEAERTLVHTPPEDEDPADEAEWKRPVHLMTALRAKGKEFDTVVVLDANDGIWPSKLATTEAALEQERRLFYVAVTRARSRLFFVLSGRLAGGDAGKPSPYLAEMGL